MLHTIDADSYLLASAYNNKGDAHRALGKHLPANEAYQIALSMYDKEVGPRHPERADTRHGMGASKLAQGLPSAAIPLLSEALEIRRQPGSDAVLLADTQFALARALWQSNGDRTRARDLATAAGETYRTERRAQPERTVETWLADRVHTDRKRRTPHQKP
jgi:serine/threonine-protein kinase